MATSKKKPTTQLEADVPISSLNPASYNPRRMPPEQMAKLVAGIRRFGVADPIVANTKGRVVVGGHQRLKAAAEAGLDVVPVAWVTLSAKEERALNLALNKISGEWDDALLAEILAGLESDEELTRLTAFNEAEIEDLLRPEVNPYAGGATQPNKLASDYLVPPFTVLDARQGYWQTRKAAWIARGIDSGEGRGEGLIKGLQNIAQLTGSNLTGTSIFDPVLAELAVRWFCPPRGHVLDPFAGGSVRGVVSAMLGRSYTGVDLRPEQVEANERQWAQIKDQPAVDGFEQGEANWIAGDSAQRVALLPGGYDLVLTCPPYADLEKYSDDPADLSNMSWPDFLDAYRKIIHDSAEKLANDRFFFIVIGEVRNKRGSYINFVGETIRACIDAGLSYYNESILVTSIGTLSLRAGRTFAASRKLGKTHQNVLVFLKGSAKAAVAACGPVVVRADGDDDEEQD